MASVAVYSMRSRANERVGRLKRDMDRSSGYMLSNMSEGTLSGKYSSSSSTASTYSASSASSAAKSALLSSTTSSTSSSTIRRPPRDSSIGALGRSNRESSLSRVGSLRLRDNSLPRMREVALPMAASTNQSAANSRYSVVMPLDNGLGSETARYNRENAIKEIHDSFMKSYKDTNDRINNRNVDEQGDRRSKAYSKIIGASSTINFVSEEEYKKQCISEMFMETGRFSTKTLAAVTSLENADTRKKKDYNWRKTMDEYETSGQMERDRKARNIANHISRRADDSTITSTSDLPRKREIRDNDDDGDIWAVKKAPRKPDSAEVSKPLTQSRPAAETKPQPTSASKPAERAKPAEVQEPVPERKSWRDNHPEKQLAARQQQNKDERAQLLQQLQQQKLEQQKAAAAAAKAAAAATAAASTEDETEMKVDSVESDQPSNPAPAAEGEAEKAAEDQDEDGMKKMRKDFFANMSNLDEEMEAGRSKLAKLRERIRRAKGAIKEADDALQKSS